MTGRVRLVCSIVGLVLLALVAVMWVRSYWTLDDWFLIYRGHGSERLYCVRGTFVIRHSAPAPGESRGGFGRLSRNTYRIGSISEADLLSDRGYSSHHEWHGIAFDAVPESEVRRVLQLRAALAQAQQQLDALPDSAPIAKEVQLSRQVNSISTLLMLRSDAQNARWRVTFQAWQAALAVLLPLVLWWLVPLLRGARRRRLKLCARCGYDLRASSDRCPECGEPVPGTRAPGRDGARVATPQGTA